MIFSDPLFFVFLAVLLCLYQGARTYPQRASIMLVGSLLFYASWKPEYLILLGLTVGINYLIYHRLTRTRSRALLIGGLVFNLTLLGALKYLGMLLETLIGTSAALGLAFPGLDADSTHWAHWALPLGISFYTFHMLSVMIDVYRGDWTTPIGFRAWCLYVTFFPHMVAGPILRASELVEQLERLAPLRAEDMRLGALILLGGLIKKILFADNLAGVADELFNQPQHLNLASAWLATTAFALQIYFDFSGYSEMAIGLARMFGVDLPRNFRYPYISRNPQEFWQRWHITLSRWLRDYLYVSLGGNRAGPLRTLVNLMLTMVLGGLWHGAAWTFVFWGFLHGAWLVAHRLWRRALDSGRLPASALAASLTRLLAWPVSITMVWITWVFFRATSFDQAWHICSRMFGLSAAQAPVAGVRSYVWLLTLVAMGVALAESWLVPALARALPRWARCPAWLRGSAYAACLLTLIFLGGSSQKFIYFDF